MAPKSVVGICFFITAPPINHQYIFLLCCTSGCKDHFVVLVALVNPTSSLIDLIGLLFWKQIPPWRYIYIAAADVIIMTSLAIKLNILLGKLIFPILQFLVNWSVDIVQISTPPPFPTHVYFCWTWFLNINKKSYY